MSSSEVLALYRAILRLGRHQLKLTDHDYFRKLVGEEFRRNKSENRPEELTFQKKVGIYILLLYLKSGLANYTLQKAQYFLKTNLGGMR